MFTTLSKSDLYLGILLLGWCEICKHITYIPSFFIHFKQITYKPSNHRTVLISVHLAISQQRALQSNKHIKFLTFGASKIRIIFSKNKRISNNYKFKSISIYIVKNQRIDSCKLVIIFFIIRQHHLIGILIELYGNI